MPYRLAPPIAALFLLSGCLTMPSAELPQNLMVKCPETLPLLTDGTGQTGALVIKRSASIYHDCKTRHNGLVDALNEN